ncbi:hypothetical protein HNY73_009932 [Argiope bruennichi]|uniref:Uncharacterized protein n=1 Tax=Argiope bruennichi TaxID=94029 RepID=A0A8T0FDN6_ARGBR|nr:hypothetical protein HNY73_009932 [Argiope bruennichi]
MLRTFRLAFPPRNLKDDDLHFERYQISTFSQLIYFPDCACCMEFRETVPRARMLCRSDQATQSFFTSCSSAPQNSCQFDGTRYLEKQGSESVLAPTQPAREDTKSIMGWGKQMLCDQHVKDCGKPQKSASCIWHCILQLDVLYHIHFLVKRSRLPGNTLFRGMSGMPSSPIQYVDI